MKSWIGPITFPSFSSWLQSLFAPRGYIWIVKISSYVKSSTSPTFIYQFFYLSDVPLSVQNPLDLEGLVWLVDRVGENDKCQLLFFLLIPPPIPASCQHPWPFHGLHQGRGYYGKAHSDGFYGSCDLTLEHSEPGCWLELELSLAEWFLKFPQKSTFFLKEGAFFSAGHE